MKLEEAREILDEVVAENGRARAWLRHKCNWEHMSALAVIRGWGDPRKVCTCGYDDDDSRVDDSNDCPCHEEGKS